MSQPAAIIATASPPLVSSQPLPNIVNVPIVSPPANDIQEIEVDKNAEEPPAEPEPKKRKVRSDVWLEFSRKKENGKVIATCSHCKKSFDGASTKGTTHLRNHLIGCVRRPQNRPNQSLLTAIKTEIWHSCTTPHKLDGAPYLRKVDFKMYSNYVELSSALEKMFSSFTIGKCNSGGTSDRDELSESRLMDLLHGSQHVLTYEDKDGDWMLVGDVPWEQVQELSLQNCSTLVIGQFLDSLYQIF